jgi:hypothetical protein
MVTTNMNIKRINSYSGLEDEGTPAKAIDSAGFIDTVEEGGEESKQQAGAGGSPEGMTLGVSELHDEECLAVEPQGKDDLDDEEDDCNEEMELQETRQSARIYVGINVNLADTQRQL